MNFQGLKFRGAAALVGALLVFVPLAAQADAPSRTITVTGQGEARGTPDQAHLSAGVTTVAATAAEAVSENNRKMDAVFSALKKLGVPERAIQTSNFSIQPQYPPFNQNQGGPQKIVAYMVSNQVDVWLDDTEKLGSALDVLVAAGANQINQVSFAIKNSDDLDRKARESAIVDATTRAETYAKAAGVTLGPVLSISEGGSETPMPRFRAESVVVTASRVPTAAGEMSVSATVTVTFELK